MKKNLSKMAARKITSAMNVFLRIDANSTSCTVVYQPKAPKGLSNSGEPNDTKMCRRSCRLADPL